MSFRIESIKVNRGGPLDRDFEFSPGELNLIYGPNESGKTYVIESLIKFLFQDKGDWNSREWSGGGRVMVSGLNDGPVVFNTTSEKLEEYWDGEEDLPRTLSRLLIVRSGETRLSDDDGDGVGHSILKDYLSAGSLLDKIDDDNRISRTIKRARVVGGEQPVIEGNNQGELKQRTETKNKVDQLRDLLNRVESECLSSEDYSLEKKKDVLDLQLERLKKAKRYQAWKLREEEKKLVEQINTTQSSEELARVEIKIEDYREKKAELAVEERKISELTDTSDNFRWAQSALDTYREITSSSAGGAVKKWPWGVLAISLVMMIAGSAIFSDNSLPFMLVGTVLAVMSAVVGYRNSEETLSQASGSAELERIRSEFQNRFDSELTNQAALEVKVDELRENDIRAKHLHERANELSDNKQSLQGYISDELMRWTGAEAPVEEGEFGDILGQLKTNREDLERERDSYVEKLTQVGVEPQEYLEEDPGTAWSREEQREIEEEVFLTDDKLSRLKEDLGELRSRVVQETNTTPQAEWLDLISKLSEKLEEHQEVYRKQTAEILAKIQVHRVIEAFREQENERIDAGLREESLADLLYSVTDGKYRDIQQIHGELAVIPDDDEPYPLSKLSTGVREQIHIALRMHFALEIMKAEKGFLILDDAFQHSDYSRRKRLVDQTVQHVRNGWQVFYFTMDDHIRGLFREVGEEMPNKFKETDLSAVSSST